MTDSVTTTGSIATGIGHPAIRRDRHPLPPTGSLITVAATALGVTVIHRFGTASGVSAISLPIMTTRRRSPGAAIRNLHLPHILRPKRCGRGPPNAG